MAVVNIEDSAESREVRNRINQLLKGELQMIAAIIVGFMGGLASGLLILKVVVRHIANLI